MATYRLLLIDDSEEFLAAADYFLTSAGYRVKQATDLAGALGAMVEGPFDLMAINVSIAADIPAIRSRERSLGHPAAVIVGLATSDLSLARERAVAAGMSECDLKPTSRSGFLKFAARWTVGLCSGFGPSLADLWPGYLSARRCDIERMRAGLAGSQFADISAIAHRLRGTGGTYGLPQLTDLGIEIGNASATSDAPRVAAALDMLDREIARLQGPALPVAV